MALNCDVLAQIIGHLPDRPLPDRILSSEAAANLQACAQVSHLFRYLAYPHLFKSVVITSGHAAIALLDILTVRGNLSSRVEIISVDHSSSEPGEPQDLLPEIVPILLPLIHCCTTLSTLRLSNVSLEAFYSNHDIIEELRKAVGRTITFLSLEGCTYSHTELWGLLLVTRNVARVTLIGNTDVEDGLTGPILHPSFHRNIQRISLDHGDPFVLSYLTLSCLTRMDMFITEPEAFETFRAHLNTATYLQRISLHLRYSPSDDHEEQFDQPHLDLSECKQLTRLDISCNLSEILEAYPSPDFQDCQLVHMMSLACHSPILSQLILHIDPLSATVVDQLPWTTFSQLVTPFQEKRQLKMKVLVHQKPDGPNAAECVKNISLKLQEGGISGFRCQVYH